MRDLFLRLVKYDLEYWSLLVRRTARTAASGGFTLIELLVVIAIVGLLASIVLASLSSARAKGRDSKRLGDLRNLQTALEVYANANNGAYPTTSGAWWGTCSTYGSHTTSGSNGWIPNLAPTYVAVLPTDPKPVGTNNCYLYRSNGVDYMLLAYGTVETYPSGKSPRPRPSGPTQLDFAIYTPGATNW